MYDTVLWGKHAAKIIDKRKQLVPLIARPWQLRFDESLEAQRAAGEPMRAIVLKARKLGFSTWVAAKFLQRLTQLEYQAAVVVAQDVKTAGVLFDMAKTMHRHLPTAAQLELGFSIRPEVIAASFSPNGRKFMEFGYGSRRERLQGLSGGESLLEIDTAQTPESGRGYTPSMVHCSEVAHWPDNGKLLGLLNAVPNVAETIVVLESTANGFNHFRKRWLRAMEAQEDPELGGRYVPIFAAWHEDPDCTRRFPTEEARERFVASIGTGPYGDDEPMLVERFGCTPEQLYWRRTTIREQTDDSLEDFKQEYPATPDEAFKGSGRTVFSSILISRALTEAERTPQPVRGFIAGDEFEEKPTKSGTVLIPKRGIWVPDEQHVNGERFEVWAHPRNEHTQQGLPLDEQKPDGQYIVFLDPAEGLQDGDWHALQVLDHETREQVAQWRGKLDAHELRMLTLAAALYYNEAWIGVETTGGWGLPIVVPLVIDYRYRYVFRQRKQDQRRDKVQERLGWRTDVSTKPLMEAAMLRILKENPAAIASVTLVNELLTYVEHDDGHHGAEEDEHDDLLMAFMGAQRIADLLKPKKPKGERRSDRGFKMRDPQMGY